MTRSGNCPPGIVVDRGVTSPYYFDFFLLSHNVPGGEGTARPAHYFVLQNEIGFTPKQLQDLTFSLCFTYCKSTTSVSYVTAAYYADRLCERASLYLLPFQDWVKSSRQQRELTPADVFRQAAGMFQKGGGGSGRKNNDRDLENPWHRNFDGKMFWM